MMYGLIKHIANAWKKAEFKRFIGYYFGFAFFAYFLRLCSNQMVDFSRDIGYVLTFALLFALIVYLGNFARRQLLLFVIFIGLHILCSLIKLKTEINVPDRELTHTLGVAVIAFSAVYLLHYVAQFVNMRFLRYILQLLSGAMYALFLIFPLSLIGYTLVNDAVFSADIMLTLFQTNPGEIGAYLRDRNLFLWSGGFGIIIVATVIQVCFFFKSAPVIGRPLIFLFSLLFFIYTATQILPKLNLNSAVNIWETTQATLESFDEFKAARIQHNAFLQKLRQLPLKSPRKGVYLLVIGESATRDHMQAYGYDRPTTPWLQQFSANPQTIVFSHAYSNHTHTLPTLSYALTEQNQYNNVDLSTAYSIIDVAKAAGYKTYWLSNQIKYSVVDTPINSMAAAADENIWINSVAGEKILSTYYDEKLVKVIPDLQNVDKALIILHLMGSHSTYRDRYPPAYNQFHGRGKRIDAYDNSILYTDKVLQSIYEKVKNVPHYMGMVYLSDHGDDVDNDFGHECSRFTHRMARIPLFIHVSDKFAQDRAADLAVLQSHHDAYWSNDLLYDLLVNLLDIKGLPSADEKYNLLSPQYDMPRDKLLLLYGEQNLQNEVL